MMLGGAGTGSACHQDRKGTPFWLAMLHGRKKVAMYSRADVHLLYPFGMLDQGSFSSFRFDPFDPDYDEFRAWVSCLAVVCLHYFASGRT